MQSYMMMKPTCNVSEDNDDHLAACLRPQASHHFFPCCGITKDRGIMEAEQIFPKRLLLCRRCYLI